MHPDAGDGIRKECLVKRPVITLVHIRIPVAVLPKLALEAGFLVLAELDVPVPPPLPLRPRAPRTAAGQLLEVTEKAAVAAVPRIAVGEATVFKPLRLTSELLRLTTAPSLSMPPELPAVLPSTEDPSSGGLCGTGKRCWLRRWAPRNPGLDAGGGSLRPRSGPAA
jgi:hypothetical protein